MGTKKISLKSPAHEFENTLAAARKGDDACWELGDALRKDCGDPTEVGKNTDSNKKLEQARAALSEAGFDYSFRRLEVLRSVAFKFKDRRQHRSVSFDAHLAAGDPD